MEHDRVSGERDGGSAPEDRPAVRPSGAPEIPEILRERPAAKSEKSERSMTSLAKGLALGWDLVGSVAAGLVIGVLLDRWLGTSPAFVLVGLVVGLFGSTWRLVQQSARDARRTGRGGSAGGSTPRSSDDAR